MLDRNEMLKSKLRRMALEEIQRRADEEGESMLAVPRELRGMSIDQIAEFLVRSSAPKEAPPAWMTEEIVEPPPPGLLQISDKAGVSLHQVKIGEIIRSNVLMNRAPIGFTYCDGALLNKNTFWQVYDIIGETFGSGQINPLTPKTHFRVPDYRKCPECGMPIIREAKGSGIMQCVANHHWNAGGKIVGGPTFGKPQKMSYFFYIKIC